MDKFFVYDLYPIKYRLVYNAYSHIRFPTPNLLSMQCRMSLAPEIHARNDVLLANQRMFPDAKEFLSNLSL